MNIAAYLRVSTEEQKDRATIESQRDYAEKYADLHGITFKYYAEDGFTGTLPLSERPVGKILMDDVRAGKINEVLVYKIDRFGRNTRVILNSVYELEQAGAVIKSMTEPFDTSTPTGRFMLSIMASVAALDRDNTIERLWNGANRCAKEDGRWMGGIVPYGYKCVDKFLQIDEQEASVVKMMYEKMADGSTTVKLADYLNANNTPTAYTNGHGKRKVGTTGIWTPGRVRNLLVSTIYYGHHEYGRRAAKVRETIPRKMPAIVSRELWEKCRKQLTENMIIDPHNRIRDYLLRGLIKCGACGLNYSGFNYKGRIQDFYRCNGKSKYRGPIHGTCPSPNVPVKDLDGKVWSRIEEFFANPGQELDELRRRSIPDRSRLDEIEREESKLRKAVAAKMDERAIVIEMAKKRIISQDEAGRQLDTLLTEKSFLDDQIRSLENKKTEAKASADDFASIESMLTEMRGELSDLSFDKKMAIVKQLVESVTVTRDGDTTVIDVNYKFVAHDRTDIRAETCYKFSEAHSIPMRFKFRPPEENFLLL